MYCYTSMPEHGTLYNHFFGNQPKTKKKKGDSTSLERNATY